MDIFYNKILEERHVKTKLFTILVTTTILVGILSGCTEKKETPTNEAPVANFTTPDNIYLDKEFTFTDRSTDDVGIESWSWDFDGDGTEDSNISNPTHTYIDIGNYEVTLIVTDAEGETGTITKTVTVGYSPPTVSFIYYPPTNITVDVTTMTFTDTTIIGDAAIANWTWDFGDDSDLVYTQNAEHIFTTVGTFIVTLTVIDERGLISTATAEIIVIE